MITSEDVRETGGSTMKELADRLKPYLAPTSAAPAAATGGHGLAVTVARMNKNTAGGKTLAWVDLTFHCGAIELHTIEGFKLMQTDGRRWLAVPQQKKVKVDPSTDITTEKWTDTYKPGKGNLVHDMARHAAIAAFDQGATPDIGFGDPPPGQ